MTHFNLNQLQIFPEGKVRFEIIEINEITLKNTKTALSLTLNLITFDKTKKKPVNTLVFEDYSDTSVFGLMMQDYCDKHRVEELNYDDLKGKAGELTYYINKNDYPTTKDWCFDYPSTTSNQIMQSHIKNNSDVRIGNQTALSNLISNEGEDYFADL